MVHSFPICPQLSGTPGGSSLNSLGCLGPLGLEESNQGPLCTHVWSQRVPRTGWDLTWMQQPWLWTRWFPVLGPCLVVHVPPAQTLQGAREEQLCSASSDTPMSMLSPQVLSSLRAPGVTGIGRLWRLGRDSRAHREKAGQGELKLSQAVLSISRARAQASRCCASRSCMHSPLEISPRSGAANSSFLSCIAPFSLCLPMAPADAAADKQTRRARQQLPACCAVPWEAQTWQL